MDAIVPQHLNPWGRSMLGPSCFSSRAVMLLSVRHHYLRAQVQSCPRTVGWGPHNLPRMGLGVGNGPCSPGLRIRLKGVRSSAPQEGAMSTWMEGNPNTPRPLQGQASRRPQLCSCAAGSHKFWGKSSLHGQGLFRATLSASSSTLPRVLSVISLAQGDSCLAPINWQTPSCSFVGLCEAEPTQGSSKFPIL